jgi:hypothetical protein
MIMKSNDVQLDGDKSSKRPRKWKGIGLLAMVSAAWLGESVEAHAASKCLSFDGLQHCSVAGAVLEISPKDRLRVHNPTRDPNTGVTIDVPNVRSWEAEGIVDFAGTADDVLKAESISEGVVTSRAQVKRSPEGFAFTAAFTGSVENRTYRVDVFLDGVRQGGAVDVPSGLGGTPVTLGVLQEFDVDIFNFIVQPNGACQWGFRSSAAGGHPITLPDGQTLLGDEIRMTEQVKSAGGYPYTTFDGLVFRGNFVALEFESETVE